MLLSLAGGLQVPGCLQPPQELCSCQEVVVISWELTNIHLSLLWNRCEGILNHWLPNTCLSWGKRFEISLQSRILRSIRVRREAIHRAAEARVPSRRPCIQSLTARCPARSRHPAHGLPAWVEAAFHLLAEVMPKCNSSELIVAPSSDNECSLPRGCSYICKSFGVRAPFPCAVFAQLMWLRLCCDVALRIMLIK